MAAASAALKLGSFVKEDAICSIRKCWNCGDDSKFLGLLQEFPPPPCSWFILSAFGFVRSNVIVGPFELTLTEVEHATELWLWLFPSAVVAVTQRLEEIVSAFTDGCGWLCSPS